MERTNETIKKIISNFSTWKINNEKKSGYDFGRIENCCSFQLWAIVCHLIQSKLDGISQRNSRIFPIELHCLKYNTMARQFVDDDVKLMSGFTMMVWQLSCVPCAQCPCTKSHCKMPNLLFEFRWYARIQRMRAQRIVALVSILRSIVDALAHSCSRARTDIGLTPIILFA